MEIKQVCKARTEAQGAVWSVWVCSMQASNIDDVLGHHTSFLDNCLKDCMLTNPELLKVFSKLMSVCVMFTNCMQVRWPRPAHAASLSVSQQVPLSVPPEPHLARGQELPATGSLSLPCILLARI